MGAFDACTARNAAIAALARASHAAGSPTMSFHTRGNAFGSADAAFAASRNCASEGSRDGAAGHDPSRGTCIQPQPFAPVRTGNPRNDPNAADSCVFAAFCRCVSVLTLFRSG